MLSWSRWQEGASVLAPGWQLRLAEGEHTLQSLLAGAVGSEDAEVPGVDVSEVLRANNYDAILASEEKSAR